MSLTLQAPEKVLFQQGIVLYQATCWRITRKDATVLRFTDNPSELTWGGETFTPAGGLELSARRRQIGLKGHDAEAAGFLSSSYIDEDDLVAGRYQNATVEEYLVHPLYPWMSQVQTGYYQIADVRYTGEYWETDVLSIASLLNQRSGRSYEVTCDWDVGDSRCGVNLTLWTVTGLVVESSIERSSFDAIDGGMPSTVNGVSVADDFWNNAKITWKTGDNAGVISEVADYTHTDVVFQLFNETPRTIQAGDTFDISRGCDKIREGECLTIYDNVSKFGGFDWMPGPDKSVQSPPL